MDGAIDAKVWRLAQPVSLVLTDAGKPPLEPTGAPNYHRPEKFGELLFLGHGER